MSCVSACAGRRARPAGATRFLGPRHRRQGAWSGRSLTRVPASSAALTEGNLAPPVNRPVRRVGLSAGETRSNILAVSARLVQAWSAWPTGPRPKGLSVAGLAIALTPGELSRAGGSSSGCAWPPTSWRRASYSALTTAPAPALAPQASASGAVRGLRRPAVGERIPRLLAEPGRRASGHAPGPGRIDGRVGRPRLALAPRGTDVSKLLPRGIFATALGAVLLAPSVVLLFGLAAVPVSWLFFAAVPSALLVAFIAHPIGVTNDWWRRLIAIRAIGWVAFSFVVLSLATAAMAVAPPVPVAGHQCGVRVVQCLVMEGAGPGGRRPAPGALSRAGRTRGDRGPGRRRDRWHGGRVRPCADGEPSRRQHRSFTVSVGQWAARAGRLGVRVDLGREQPAPGAGGLHGGPVLLPGPRPRPENLFRTRAMDTVKALPELDRMLLAQVTSLYTRTGRPVDVVAESEGALVAKTALLTRARLAGGNTGHGQPARRPGPRFLPGPRGQRVGGGGRRSDAASERCVPGGGACRSVAG